MRVMSITGGIKKTQNQFQWDNKERVCVAISYIPHFTYMESLNDLQRRQIEASRAENNHQNSEESIKRARNNHKIHVAFGLDMGKVETAPTYFVYAEHGCWSMHWIPGLRPLFLHGFDGVQDVESYNCNC